MSDITFYISIISTCLLAISETLPYIQKIQSNGIFEFFICLIKILNKKNTYHNINSLNEHNETNIQNNQNYEKLYNSITILTDEEQ